jgi:Asp-tRNA(Asn)/Glu-tRNA(Gln) amidotransferase A subunit family amidase
MEATVADIHAAYAAGATTCRDLAEWYLARVDAYDRAGPAINSVITVNPKVREEADALDAAYRAGGPTGPLHGVPVLVKDQVDTVGMPTTLGSVLFRDYFPDRDATVIEKLKAAGALILAKSTLGELGGGDTHGTLFGSTRNPYDLERTVGGSSGGSAAGVSANLAAVAIGQEGLASIRRPSAWNCTVGMRPTLGLVSRTGAYGGWPSRAGSLGPMTRTVEDTARLLDATVGYDPADPSTAYGVGRAPASFTDLLDPEGLRGVRIGVIRESVGLGSEPESADYARVSEVFDRAVAELAAAGAIIVDPVGIPGLHELLAKRMFEGTAESFEAWMNRSANPPFRSYAELIAHPEYEKIMFRRSGGRPPAFSGTHHEYLVARDQLMNNLLTLMADHQLDTIVHKTTEHSPTLIRDGVNPPYVNQKGAPHLNTFLFEVPTISVPAGFTSEQLPVGLAFLGRPFSDGAMVRYAYAYEQATRHRRPPASAPPLAGPARGDDTTH